VSGLGLDVHYDSNGVSVDAGRLSGRWQVNCCHPGRKLLTKNQTRNGTITVTLTEFL